MSDTEKDFSEGASLKDAKGNDMTAEQYNNIFGNFGMSDTEKDLAVHVAVCDERYRNIEASLKSGERRMTKIEYLIYGCDGIGLAWPGCGGAVFPQFLWDIRN